MKKTIQTIIVLFLAGAATAQASAATLSLVSQCDNIPANETCSVDIILETTESVNTIEAEAVISGVFELAALNEANSIVSYWVEKPSISNGGKLVSLAGIIPGGFTGRGEVLNLTLKATEVGGGLAEFKTAVAYLNDGFGSRSDLETQSASLVSTEAVDGFIPREEEPDLDPPLNFSPEVTSDTNIFSGRWFVVFQTQDKGAGIDHYEIAETKTDYISESNWKVAVSPYRLHDQKLTSYIYIKAIDRAGNERVEIIPPHEVVSPEYDRRGMLVVLLVIVIIAVVALSRQKRNTRQNGII